ncbi:site-specific integrase [Allochromatium humboldtianum]|uniref:Site-specific integrase n=1 Tax=Allochromatium humboldtianum TaxID=504901 RepID=A0A850R262_9GAMM|nr:site-specific integrase [Allochromatium humboldtianum]NVZ07674.1 site-specific integrase [Allochromatium humboldtianum]
MASIRKFDNRAKPWQVSIRRKGQRFVEYFRTKKDADAFAAKVEADFDRWAKILGGELRRHTLADLIDRYMDSYQGKDTTLPARMAWWRDQYGDRLLSEFNDDTLRDGLAHLAEGTAKQGGCKVTETDRKRSPATLNRYKTAIGTLYKAAIDAGWYGIKINPAAGIRQRKENNSRFGRVLEDDERARLLEACDQSTVWRDLGLFVRLALATGARRGELLGLEWRDVDLKGGSILLRETKNGDDRRVPLLGEVRALLIERAKVRRLDDPRVFPSAKRDTSPPIDKAWNAAKEIAQVENLRIHDLRHSCGSYLAKAGASAFQIAAILGHRSGPGLTARYVHLVAEDSRDLLETALSGVLMGKQL